ncbi:MAG TPA: hypothetical protein VLD19_16175, partial [Chitinophagaceae bacterium]|nr:hypothetical protein [Chitinophagaceae bacterium]
NGIIGEGCRIFYGVKAVRFFMASHSQLKYGARLINSYLGNNATISCCEVLNSLIFPAHEQHHNNSFLCAALIMGQSNIAAGATIGSNHNSRSADGELIAGRGFWPGLCVSLKHNSRFASFTILAKGDYPAELNIPFPFSLVSNDVSADRLVIMPAYWFMYNMYAMARNAWKSVDRDKRIDQTQQIEYDFLAPDSVNEILYALDRFKIIAGRAWAVKHGARLDEKALIAKGMQLLETHDKELDELELLADGIEHSGRKVVLVKVLPAWHLFKKLVSYYAATQVLQHIKDNGIKTREALLASLPAPGKPAAWINAGGQLVPQQALQKTLGQVRSGRIKGWDDIHRFYREQATLYAGQKLQHALAALLAVEGINLKKGKEAL